MNLKSLETFIKQVKNRYGKEALDFRIELHYRNGVHTIPKEIDSLQIANYKADKINGYPAEKVVVIR